MTGFIQRHGYAQQRLGATVVVLFLVGFASLFVLAALDAHPPIECDGRTMFPGDTCQITTVVGGQAHVTEETYAQRAATAAERKDQSTIFGSAAALGLAAIAIAALLVIWIPGPTRAARLGSKAIRAFEAVVSR